MTNEVKRRLIYHLSYEVRNVGFVICHFEIWKKRMNSAKWWCLVLFLVFSSSSGSAQIASRPADQWITLLESPDRVANLKVPQVVAALRLERGYSVADIGAGSGLFSRALARTIDPGLLYSVDIDPELLKHIDGTCKTESITDIRTIQSSPKKPNTQ